MKKWGRGQARPCRPRRDQDSLGSSAWTCVVVARRASRAPCASIRKRLEGGERVPDHRAAIERPLTGRAPRALRHRRHRDQRARRAGTVASVSPPRPCDRGRGVTPGCRAARLRAEDAGRGISGTGRRGTRSAGNRSGGRGKRRAQTARGIMRASLPAPSRR